MQNSLKYLVNTAKRPRTVLFGLLVSVVLYLPSLGVGLLIDDYYQNAWMGDEQLIKPSEKLSLFGLFSFVDDNAERRQQLLNNALLPWWTDEAFGFNFFRPLSELTHWFDYRILQDYVPLMHAHSLLWLILCSLVLFAVYRRLYGATPIAILAFLLFIFDATHVFTVVWISNRNAVLSCLFGLLMLLFYLQGRDGERSLSLPLALAAFVASLCSGEIGVSAFFYLFCYIFIVEERPLSERARAIFPFGLVFLGYLLFYKFNGFGATGNTAKYLDPFSEPVAFLGGAISRIPIVLFSQFGILTADISFGIAREVWQLPLVLAAILIFLGLIFWPLLRDDRLSRFFLAGTVFATLPIIAGTPSDRNLFLVGVGGSGLIASCLNYWWSHREILSGIRRVLTGVCAWFLIVVHLVLSPILIAVVSYALIEGSRAPVRLAQTLPEGIDLSGKQVAFVHAPFMAAALFAPIRYWLELPLPSQSWWITEIGRPVYLSRIDNHTLSITMDKGFVYGHSEQLFRLPSRVPFGVGDTVVLDGVRIEVKKVAPDGQPLEITTTFSRDLDDPNLVFLSFIDSAYRRQDIPPEGETLMIEDSTLNKRQ